MGRYFGSSVKGQAEIDWDDEAARQVFLQGIVADADRLLERARQKLQQVGAGSQQEQHILAAAELLAQLLCQDIERHDQGGPQLKHGVAKDRVVSVHDPEMRYGHKSKSKRFEGHKLALAAEPESQLITALEVLPGNAYDSDRALELVAQSEANTGLEVEETLGDCAYGDGATREQFEQAGRRLIARVALQSNGNCFSKEAFTIDLEAMTCSCPAGQVTHQLTPVGRRPDRQGRSRIQQAFRFDAVMCSECALRPACVRAGPGKGRTVSLHPQERLLQEARALQESPGFAENQRMRQASEHRLARIVQLGVRQARYFGRTKTLFQALMAAAVANLTLIARKTGQIDAGKSARRAVAFLLSYWRAVASAFSQHWILQVSSSRLCGLIIPSWRPGFRPDF